MKNRTSDLHVKAAFRPVFLALRKDIRRHEGGLIALAAEMGRTGPNANNILSNRFNPDDLTHQPTLRDFLDVIETLPALNTINAIMSYALMDWRQAQQQAEVTGSRPVLFWRASRRPWVAYVDLHDVSPAAFPVRGRHRCAMSLDDWCQLAREAA